ncbi:unnamed protein product, partial [Urochloa humidicola]
MWERSRAEDERAEREAGPTDFLADQAAVYRTDWIATRSRYHGSFDDETRIPAMRFTDEPPPPDFAFSGNALQVFSARVSERRTPTAAGTLRWPLRSQSCWPLPPPPPPAGGALAAVRSAHLPPPPTTTPKTRINKAAASTAAPGRRC